LLLQSAADAPNAIASIAAAVAEGTIAPAEAGELLRLVETYLKALDAQNALQKTGNVISIADLRAARERNFALVDEIARRIAVPELTDGSPNGGGSTDYVAHHQLLE